MYLLDVNVVSELRKPPHRLNPGVAHWARANVGRSAGGTAAFISVIGLIEIERGVRLMERRDPRQGQNLRRWLDGEVRPNFDGALLPVTEAIAKKAAAYQVPDPRPLADSLMAATAAIHGLTLVTRNTVDFATFDVALINPFTGEPSPEARRSKRFDVEEVAGGGVGV
ncbi:MAG: type II toxin-antitoxin system VapC family toxin [Bifidobacteriaceae bacterium]|jgi:predicted nucleic acid-binding protein|nr:type II toxin-antitoxin system VapC family toxin [Bifidobacteriaceae bacterium]